MMGKILKSRVLVVMGGDVIKGEDGIFRTMNFFEGDGFGVLGDFLRPPAAAVMYNLSKEGNRPLVIASGGESNGTIISKVIKNELLREGVKNGDILEEPKSYSTYEQFLNVQELLKSTLEEVPDELGFISNRYHLQRLAVILRRGPGLESLRMFLANGIVKFISAEEVVYQKREELRDQIDEAYASEQMLKRVELETQGLRQLLEGTYKFRIGKGV